MTDTPYIFMDSQNKSSWFLSFQDEWQFAERWNFTGGVRYDHYSDFGGTINPRLALVWETTSRLTTKLMYGRAFRAPAFAEQFTKNNPVITGNPDLEPETIDTYELAFSYNPLANLAVQLNIFSYRAEDLVEYIGALPAPAENYGEQEGKGFEIELNWQASKTFLLRSNFAYQRAINLTTDSVVPDAPEFQFYLNPRWRFGRDWSLDGQYYLVGGRKRALEDPREEVNDYDLVNLTLRKKNIFRNLEGALAVRNLFDEDIREPSPYDPSAPSGAFVPDDYPMESRSIWAELRYTF